MVRRLAFIAALLLPTLLAIGIADGEITQGGNIRMTLNGSFTPSELPRSHSAPVNVDLSGSIAVVGGGRPSPLRRISIAVNRHGGLVTRGLPVCRSAQIANTTTKVALSRCRGALVGEGRFGANVALPGAPFPAEGRALAFNGRDNHGRPAILVHIYSRNPVEVAFVLPFKIAHPRRGDYGTVLSTRIPKIASDLGYLTEMHLRFGRRWRFRGERESFLNADCAAPPGFPEAVFSFVKGNFTFANGQVLSTTVSQVCRVR